MPGESYEGFRVPVYLSIGESNRKECGHGMEMRSMRAIWGNACTTADVKNPASTIISYVPRYKVFRAM